MPVQFGRSETQLMIRDVVRAGSEVACDCMELRSSSGPWARLRSVLSELGASPSSNSGLVSSSTEPHLKLVIASVHLCNERRNGSERGLAQCTATWVAGALRQPQGALTSARADALDRKSANRTDFTANFVSRLPSTGACLASQC